MIETPVLIVGGGPVGLALAVDLGWRGVPCILVERGDGLIVAPKMNEVNTRTMEFCRRWGIADDVKTCPFPADFPMDVAVVTAIGAYELGRIPRPARKYQHPGPFSPEHMQVCAQTWFDPILRRRAETFPHVTLLFRHKLESFTDDGIGVRARVTNLASGESIEIRADYLAGCDGASSSIRRSLDIEDLGSPALSSAMHLFLKAENVFEKMGVEPGVFFAAVDETGYWGNVRLIDPVNGLWRILFDVAPDFDPKSIDYEHYKRRAFAKDIDVEWVTTSQWTRRGVVANKFSVGRVYLAGDSVHQVSPTGALGMNTGIADAVDLGWKIAAVYEGWGGPALLASYSIERQPACARNVSMTTKYYEGQAQFKNALTGIESPTEQGETVRANAGADVLAHVTRIFATIGLQIGYRYDRSPICISDGSAAPPDDPATYVPSARPGARAPHVLLKDGRSTLDLFGRGFVLLTLNGESAGREQFEERARELNVPLTSIAIDDSSVASVYERSFVLVRPDGHVAWRGDALPDDTGALLARVTGHSDVRISA